MTAPSDTDHAAGSSPIRELLRAHALPLAMALLSTAFAAIGQQATAWLRYDRGAILHGQWWRILTGNVVHLGWPHLLLNLAGLILVWLLFRHTLTSRSWILVTLMSAAAVGCGLLLFDPRLEWYVGLSGVLHGLFAAGVVAALYTGNRSDWWLLALLVTKIAWEQTVGSMPGSAEIAGGNVIVDAHLYGAIGGTVAVVTIIMAKRRRRA